MATFSNLSALGDAHNAVEGENGDVRLLDPETTEIQNEVTLVHWIGVYCTLCRCCYAQRKECTLL